MTPSDLQPWPESSLAKFHPAIEGCARGRLPPNITVMQLALAASRPEEIEAALSAARAAVMPRSGEAEVGERLDSALRMWRDNPQAFSIIKALMDSVDHAADGLGPDHWAETYDRIAAISPEGSVALYSLGNPDLLRAATDEVLAWLASRSLLGDDRRVLEIGCGIGRLLAALSPHVAEARGLDVSAGMVQRARERCAGLRNVSVGIASGRDLAGEADGSVHVVLASDVFPYLVQSGSATVERHLEEVARVLVRGGHLAILNFSYCGDHQSDRAELDAAAARNGLALCRAATGDFALWDAATFLLRKS